MTLTRARQVADAVLYEGYLLYPYRASSPKNQVRWQFGVLGPQGAAEAGVGELPSMSAQVLLEQSEDVRLVAYLRFLQVQSRVVERATPDGWVPVDELLVDGTRWIPFHEAVATEIPLHLRIGNDPQALEVEIPGGCDITELVDGGQVVGRLVRTRWPLQGIVTSDMRPGTDPRVAMLALGVQNSTPWSAQGAEGWTDRDVAARYSFVGTHVLLTARGTRFVSLLDGPEWSASDAAACVHERCWPVLISDDDGVDAVLISPIILGDHPAIAPESTGDLFDATEIDEILTLRVQTMTDAEKADARGTDPRAAAILARCDAMSEDAMGRLHGAQRSPAAPLASGGSGDDVPVYGELKGDDAAEDQLPWWDAGQDARAAPESDAVMVGGVPVAAGTRVLLRPSRRADAQDVFLAGLTAVVARVYFDVDGGTHVAVMLEDDPGADLYGATGRFYYFGPDEIEPLPAREEAR